MQSAKAGLELDLLITWVRCSVLRSPSWRTTILHPMLKVTLLCPTHSRLRRVPTYITATTTRARTRTTQYLDTIRTAKVSSEPGSGRLVGTRAFLIPAVSD